MSNVVLVGGRRVPSQLRAAFGIVFGCALVGGCSTGTERFTSASFGSGYDAGASASASSFAPGTQNVASSASYVQRASYAPAQPAASYQPASATPNTSGGYLQVSRVDLPPLQPQNQASQTSAPRVKTADGYGAYNRGPIPDGTYSGPRVYTPYDAPRDEPSAPPAGAYRPYPEEPRRYDRSGDDNYSQRAPNFYKKSGEERVYEPQPEQAAPSYQRDDRRNAQPPAYYPEERAPRYRGGAENIAPSSYRENGTVVTVARGETLYTLAVRHGVTVDMIARANDLNGRAIRPGQQLLIPRAAPASYTQVQNTQPKAEAAGCAGSRCHVVRLGDTIGSIARTYGVHEKSILEANNIPGPRSLKVGQAIVIPEAATNRQVIAATPAQRETPVNSTPKSSAPATAAASPAVGEPKGPATDAASQPKALPEVQPKPAPENQAKPASELKPAAEVKTASMAEATCDAALANPMPRTGKTFRKPVEGLVIAQFGAQRDGTVNEGVTISVPKGTPIKAAENGVVAYVGDELPGFGNLILIRHADEYVTAYAHADEIMVKKCDVVKRGQIVAKAGASGDASQPQLHFEIRKNSKPVDPSPLLAL